MGGGRSPGKGSQQICSGKDEEAHKSQVEILDGAEVAQYLLRAKRG